MSDPQNEPPIEKQIKPNDTALSDSPDQLDIRFKRHTLALLLENVAKIIEACASELRNGQTLDSNINCLGLYTQDLLKSLQEIKPKVTPEFRTAQLCAEFRQTDSHPILNEGFSSIASMANVAEKDIIYPRKTISSPPDLRKEECTRNTQSKFKNCYGLVMGRAIKSIRAYLKEIRYIKSKTISENSQYYYIHEIICELSDSEVHRFEEYLHQYNMRSDREKKNRGKTTAYKFLEQDIFSGIILIKIIQSFLQKDNTDFQKYIGVKTKPKKQVSRVLSDENNLTQLRDSFSEMQFYLEQNMDQNTKSEAF